MEVEHFSDIFIDEISDISINLRDEYPELKGEFRFFREYLLFEIDTLDFYKRLALDFQSTSIVLKYTNELLEKNKFINYFLIVCNRIENLIKLYDCFLIVENLFESSQVSEFIHIKIFLNKKDNIKKFNEYKEI